MKHAPSRRIELTAELKATTQRQTSIIRQISDRAAEGRPRLVILDDQLDVLEQQFLAAAQNDLMAKIASGEIDTGAKKQKLLEAYAEELRSKYPEWENLQVTLVAGAGFEPAAFRL